MAVPNSDITFRTATPADIPLLKYWDTKQHVIDCDPDSGWDWDYELNRSPSWRQQLMAELQGEPIGFVQIIDAHLEESHYWGEIAPYSMAIDIWIGEEANLNRGYGTQMMRMAIAICFADPNVSRIWIDPLKSNHKAHRFYERLGFEFQEERLFGAHWCRIYALDREVVDE